MMKKAFLKLFLISSLIIGCTTTNISSNPKYEKYIGQSYTAKEDMKIVGLNSEWGDHEKIILYTLRALSKFDHNGPEVVTKDIFPKGGTFVINEAFESFNCLCITKTRWFSITTNDFNKKVDVPLVIYMHEVFSEENVEKVK